MDTPPPPNRPDSALIRLDSPHLARGSEPERHPERASVAVATASGGASSAAQPSTREPSVAETDQLRHHASQIEAQLRRERQQLDAREAEFHAQVAQLEAELRLSRLRQLEREEELQQRAWQLEEQEHRLSERAADLAIAEDHATRHRPTQTPCQAGDQRELRRVITVWQERVRGLDAQERQLQAQRADLVRDRQRLDAERGQLSRLREEQATAHDAERERLRAKAEQGTRELNDRAARLDRREQSIRQMHDDLSRLYRGAIETQLCTEELWSQLQADYATAELTARLATLRQKLAEEFQLSEQFQLDLQQKLQETREAIESESQSMAQQRDELREWFYRRQQEMERHARELLRRESEMNAQEANFRSVEQHWDDQRRELEAEIRRLRRLLHH